MRQSRKQPEQTRQKLVTAAGDAFARSGYHATGIGTIVADAGLTKGALFHHFPDKRALAVDWLRTRLADGIAADWIEPLGQTSSLDGLKTLCRARCLDLDPADPLSALTALTAEIAATDPALREAVAALFAALRGAFTALLERGKTDGWIHRSIQPAAEAAFLVSSLAGLTVTAKAQPGETTLRPAADSITAYLDTLRAQ